jgi:hypothetical protein
MIALILVMFCFGFAGTRIMVVSLQSIIVEFFSLQSHREVPLVLVLACPEMRAWIVTGSIQVCPQKITLLIFSVFPSSFLVQGFSFPSPSLLMFLLFVLLLSLWLSYSVSKLFFSNVRNTINRITIAMRHRSAYMLHSSNQLLQVIDSSTQILLLQSSWRYHGRDSEKLLRVQGHSPALYCFVMVMLSVPGSKKLAYSRVVGPWGPCSSSLTPTMYPYRIVQIYFIAKTWVTKCGE